MHKFRPIMLEDLLSSLTLEDKMTNCKMLNIDDFPYPAQVNLVRQLRGFSSDDIINTGVIFPGFAEVAKLSKTTWIIDKVFPFLVPYLTRIDALHCRLVCFSWIQAVDKFFEHLGLAEPNYTKPELSLSYDLEEWSKDAFGLRSCWIEDPRDITNYMNKMAHHPKNPFISRCVQINDRDSEEYWLAVTHFLERFGSEIWKLRLGCYRAFPKATVIMRNLLALVPNVKMLSLEFNGMDIALGQEEFNEIQRDLTETPFPALPDLQYLDWGMCRTFYDAALPQYSQHLVHAKLMDSQFLDGYNSSVHGTFPCLKSLVVRLDLEGELYKLVDFNSPLKTITTLTSERIRIQVYLHVFHHFAKTLESFNIEYDEEPNLFADLNEQIENVPDEVIEFPLLKTIRLENPDPDESLDSLLLVKPGPSALQIQTYIRGWMAHYRNHQQPLFRKMAGESIQIHGFLENMYDSKIWEQIPSLDTVDVKAFNQRNQNINKVYKRSEMNVEKIEE